MACRCHFSARVTILVAASLLASPLSALHAQLPDAFASHFGASRTREIGDYVSASGGLMILTQYGSRWQDPAPIPPADPFTEYDQLKATVGYNYGTFGAQRSWTGLGSITPVVSFSGILGITSDRVTKWAQNGIHDYMRYPHVPRRTVAGNHWMWGGDAEVSAWYSHYWSLLSLDLFADLGATYASHHKEQRAGVGMGINIWVLRIQGAFHKSISVNNAIDPPAVKARLKSDYWMASGLVTLDRNSYLTLRDVFPTVGAGATYSTGLFPGETEFLLSVFLEFPAGPNDSWRIEHVNDVIKDKDRGPTGGLRVVYVRR